MTPKIWNNVANKIEPISSNLAKIGLTILISYFVFLGFAFWKEYVLNQLIILPILFLFFLAGLGLIQYGFKTNIEKQSKTIDEYMAKVNNFQKFVMWQGSITMCLFFIFVTLISARIILNIAN